MKICIVTGTRAEYGLLKPLVDQINSRPEFTLQLLVTGAHLSPEFGLTYKQIEQDGLRIDAKIEMLLSSDTAEGVTKSMGIGMIGYAEAFKNLSPDLLVLLGDRYEMLAVASSAMIFKVPIVHIHGGEITEGAYDDAIRHAITKLSHLHFTSTEIYRQRVIQLGEQPERVFNVGAIGLDNIHSFSLLSKEKLEDKLNIKFKTHNYLVAFHPETLSNVSIEAQFQHVLDAISIEEDSFFIFTKANADTNGRIINQMIQSYVEKNAESSVLFSSLGSLLFLSLLKYSNAIVGNSSSGIIEAPSLNTATINIGDRQRGRIQAISVVNCTCEQNEINDAFERIKSNEFKQILESTKSPYGDGNTSKMIIDVLAEIKPELLRVKTFYDLEK